VKQRTIALIFAQCFALFVCILVISIFPAAAQSGGDTAAMTDAIRDLREQVSELRSAVTELRTEASQYRAETGNWKLRQIGQALRSHPRNRRLLPTIASPKSKTQFSSSPASSTTNTRQKSRAPPSTTCASRGSSC